MDWLRWHHGTAADPKWKVVGRIAGVSTPIVVAIWSTLVESGSENDVERGVVDGWEAEEIAALFDLSTEQVQGVYDAMQNRVLDGKRLINWEKRNPKRERDDNSTGRVQKHRQQKKGGTSGETPRNAKNSLDKIREEEIRREEEDLKSRLQTGFGELWAKYPAKDGRKDAEKYFQTTVTTDERLVECRLALANYLAHLAVNTWKRPKLGKTWFNNWPDWIHWVEPKSVDDIIAGSSAELPREHDPRHWCSGCEVPHEWQCEREDCFMTRGVSCPEFMKAYNERHTVKS